MTKILIVEDEAAIRENIAETLAEDFEVITAENGRIGVTLAREHHPDLVVCDIMMPELDGYGVLIELRSDPATSLLPFVFLTAKVGRGALRQGMELGADDFITKPFTPDELLSAIHARLERQAAIAEEHEKALDELRGNIIHMLPHELRTPLTSILGFTDLLMLDVRTMDIEQVISMVESINTAGHRLYRLVENYLVYAQTEFLRTDAKRVEVLRRLRVPQPADLIEQVAIEKAGAVGREADLTVDVAEVDSVYIVEGDLLKIVEELLDNAFKFSEPGTSVRVTARVENNNYVLRISDHGRGLTPEQITNIGAYMQFERRLYEQQGAGLGLIISKRLAELHGGELSVESAPHRETTVQIALRV